MGGGPCSKVLGGIDAPDCYCHTFRPVGVNKTHFGMRNSGSTFVRAVQKVLRPVRDITASYVDDMTVGSLDWGAHMTHIDRFLSVIKSSGLTLNLLKCEFAPSEVKFVGQFVGSGWRRPFLRSSVPYETCNDTHTHTHTHTHAHTHRPF